MKDPVTRAIERLTIAVWALSMIIAVPVVLTLVLTFGGGKLFRSEIRSASPPLAGVGHLDPRRMSALPVDKQIAAASVIALATYQPQGARRICVVSEILKRAPGTTFAYRVGDEYPEMSFYPKPNEGRGDGQLLFFGGDPTELLLATTMEGDRITGLGDMPLALFRAKVEDAPK